MGILYLLPPLAFPSFLSYTFPFLHTSRLANL